MEENLRHIKTIFYVAFIAVIMGLAVQPTMASTLTYEFSGVMGTFGGTDTLGLAGSAMLVTFEIDAGAVPVVDDGSHATYTGGVISFHSPALSAPLVGPGGLNLIYTGFDQLTLSLQNPTPNVQSIVFNLLDITNSLFPDGSLPTSLPSPIGQGASIVTLDSDSNIGVGPFTGDVTASVTEVPEPTPAVLFGTGLLLLGWIKLRRQRELAGAKVQESGTD